MPHTNPLRVEELPADVLEFYDCAGQKVFDKRIHVERTCRVCGVKEWIAVKSLRRSVRTSGPRGMCDVCYRLPGLHRPRNGPGIDAKPRNKDDSQRIAETMEADPNFCHWFAGFFDGEGSFNLTARHNKNGVPFWGHGVFIGLRSDDESVLRSICEKLGGYVGYITAPTRGASHGQVSAMWNVSSQLGCIAMCDFFDRYPLRSKKANHFIVWAKAIRHLTTTRPNFGRDEDLMQSLKAELHRVRQFIPPIEIAD